MTEVYFFDSYAVMEILKGNPNYDEFRNKTIILTKLNLFEIYHSVLYQFGEGMAEKVYDMYLPYVVEPSDDVIKNAAKLRLEHIKRRLSMADCIGYVFSLKAGVKFLTGDKEFEDFDNVEFVK